MTSSPHSRRSIEERTKMARLYAKYESSPEVQRRWGEDGDPSPPPSRKTILSSFQRLQDTGSVFDLHRSGRPSGILTTEKMENILSHVLSSPTISIRARFRPSYLPEVRFIEQLSHFALRPADGKKILRFCLTMLGGESRHLNTSSHYLNQTHFSLTQFSIPMSVISVFKVHVTAQINTIMRKQFHKLFNRRLP